MNFPDCTNSSKTSETYPLQQESEVDKDNIGDGNSNEKANEEEDEDEDADFNPLLKDTNSLDASSSLSSEIEDLDTDVADSREKPSVLFDENPIERCMEIMHIGGTIEHGDGLLMQITGSPEEICGNKSNIASMERESILISQSENGPSCDKDNDVASLTDVSNVVDSRKPQLDMDAEGAICMRTRARYSLASFTLDELETFLQETDDEDDLQNVDDEEEYKKFLAAVLRGDASPNLQESTNADDEDEENDADFELELEEALESEPEEIEERRRTRRNRHQKASTNHNVKQSGQLMRPLRPILSYASLGSFQVFDGKQVSPNINPAYVPPGDNGLTCGFTPHQIGQLHCLIHEHVQLLIQVFSISVLEPFKNHISDQVKELILELIRKRDQLLGWRTLPYPSFCFFPPYVHPSVQEEPSKMLPPDCSDKTQQHDVPSGSNKELLSDVTPLSCSPANQVAEQAVHSQAAECSSWVPYICGPVLSIIDVAPLRLVENYVDDVSSAIQAHERHQIEHGFDTHCQREPLFPFDRSSSNGEADAQVETENTHPDSGGMLTSRKNQMPKKTMAATLLEKAKNQSIALVPKEISELAQRFRPLFNPALYPHKPPLASIANRVLFTDAEDELLALGLMEYNTDWKSIQQRFLPCKTRHQIFVRQKNRASSKAPENPIKAVRRMKNSPLTPEEIERIESGLKKFKLDWISIWRFFVPYRDPSLLPRQWRISCGTQKSYKSDVHKKARRRLYEFRRKASKPSPSTGLSSSEKEGDSTDNAAEDANSGDNQLDKEDEAYVHEAFLADWRPDNNTSASFPACLHYDGSQVREQNNNPGSVELQPSVDSRSPAALRPPYSQVVLRPYRARRLNNARLVKLAPDLPAVNLPPSVRVMSQSAFQSIAPRIPGNAMRMNAVGKNPGLPAGTTTMSDVVSSMKSVPSKNNPAIIPTCSQQANHSNALVDNCSLERAEPDLQMHPLLFQPSQNGHLPYYPPNSSSSMSNQFTFFSGQQPQLSLSLFHNPRDIRDAVNFLSKSSKAPEKNATSLGVDFHPLLQTAHDVDTNSTGTRPSSSRVPSTANSRQKHALVQSPCRNNGSCASAAKDANHVGKGNDIDLDIHLSFSATNQEALASRKPAFQSTGRSSIGPVLGTVESESARDSAPDRVYDEHNSCEFAVTTSENQGSRKVSDEMVDDSLPEIVMEQEELSDSEEEFGENVEFEHEEITDSDGDSTSDSQQFVSVQNEEVRLDESDVHIDTNLVANTPSKHRSRARNKLDHESNRTAAVAADKSAHIKPNVKTPNLNSCPQPSHTNLKKSTVGYEFGPFGTTGSVALNQLSSGSKRSNRHLKVGTSQMQKDPPGDAQLPRNPRKRICRSTSNSAASSPGVDVQNCKSSGTGDFG